MTSKNSKYIDVAVACGKKFPVGSKVSWYAFMQWAYEDGWVTEPPLPEDYQNKQDDKWQGYEHRRSKFVDSISKASKRLQNPFIIRRVKGIIHIFSLHEEVVNHQVPQQTVSFAGTKIRRINEYADTLSPFTPEGEAARLTKENLEDLKDFLDTLRIVKEAKQARIRNKYQSAKKLLI